jgi:hypothetical protein
LVAGLILEKVWNGNKNISAPLSLKPGISDCRFDGVRFKSFSASD